MKLHLLAEPKMLPVPKTIKVEANWGELTIKTNLGGKPKAIRGTHILVEGTEDDIKGWLGSYDGVWIGVGNPQEQQFQVMHIKLTSKG